MVVIVSSTVPVPLTRLIGRDAEVSALRERVIGGTRLTSLCGPGGVGKTRLALAVAADLGEHVAGDVAFVDCVALRDAVQVVPAIAQALGFEMTGAVTLDALSVAADSRRALLILDNLEQIDGIGGLVSRLIARTRSLVIIGTSRVPLDVATEIVIRVDPLPSEPSDEQSIPASSPAVELFIERARSAYPSFVVSAESAATVGEICRRLDGLPLAIELAAARVPVLAPAAMLSRIERQLTVIDGGDRSLPDRHRSLGATLDWSYQLLTAVEQRRFRSLAILEGTFDLAAAGAVLESGAGEQPTAAQHTRRTAHWLTTLERQSLLVRTTPTGEAPRYAMLETVRTHARSLLREDPEQALVAERHLAWYLGVAVIAEAQLNGPLSARWLRRLDQEIANLRQALRFAIDAGRTADGLTLSVALWRYWESRGLPQEGVDAFDRLIATGAMDGVGPALRGTALNHLANLLTDLGQFRRAAGLYEDSLALRRTVGVAGPVADTLNNLGLLSLAFGDPTLARQQFSESLRIRRVEGDRWGEALAIANLGDIEVAEGNAALALALHEQALVIRTEIGDERGIAFSTSNLAEACLLAGDRVRAAQLLDQAARRFHRLRLPLGEALVRRTRGDLDDDDGQFRPALEHYHAALLGFAGLGDRGRVAEMLERVASTLLSLNGGVDALRILGAAGAIRNETGLQPGAIDQARIVAAAARGRAAMGVSAVEVSLLVGRTMGFESVIRLVETTVARLGTVPSDTAVPGRTAIAAEAAEPSSSIMGLTPREQDVLTLLAEGLTNAEIAQRLSVSPYTVNAHLRRIFRHLGVTTRTAAMQRWFQRDRP